MYFKYSVKSIALKINGQQYIVPSLVGSMLRSTASHYYITSKQKPSLPLLFIIIIRSDWVTCLKWSVHMEYKYNYLLDAEYLDCYYARRPWLGTDIQTYQLEKGVGIVNVNLV